MEKNCATCGWGVKWTRSVLDGRLHGRCQFVPSIPLPKGCQLPRFGEESSIITNCPGWKKPKDVNLVPQWGEEWGAYLDRCIDYLDKQHDVLKLEFEFYKARVIAEDPEMAARLGFIKGGETPWI